MKDEFIGCNIASNYPGDTQCSGGDNNDKSFNGTKDLIEKDVMEQIVQASGVSTARNNYPSEALTSLALQLKRKRYSTYSMFGQE